jgi:peptidoglycan/LPS O-acetylase OafA/YrhL
VTEPSGTVDPVAETIEGEPAPVPATAPLRAAGFLATVLGAALMGGGSLMHWATIHDPNDLNGSLDLKFDGIDIRNGKMALGAAAVLLVGLMALRAVRSRSTQETVAVVMVVAAVVGIAFSGAFLVDGGHRFFVQPTDIGTLGVGVLMTLAGAVVGLLGAILDLAWSVAPH